jgi:hypothetical protein
MAIVYSGFKRRTFMKRARFPSTVDHGSIIIAITSALRPSAPLVAGAPESGRLAHRGERGAREARPSAAAPVPVRDQAMAIEHRVHRADRRTGEGFLGGDETRTVRRFRVWSHADPCYNRGGDQFAEERV